MLTSHFTQILKVTQVPIYYGSWAQYKKPIEVKKKKMRKKQSSRKKKIKHDQAPASIIKPGRGLS
jgi:hypothetical protein